MKFFAVLWKIIVVIFKILTFPLKCISFCCGSLGGVDLNGVKGA